MISYSINVVFNGKWKIVLTNFQFGQGRVQFLAPFIFVKQFLIYNFNIILYKNFIHFINERTQNERFTKFNSISQKCKNIF